MPIPSKPVELMKKHLTKAEKEARETAEESLLSGEAWHEWSEVSSVKDAHKMFLRLSKLYAKIEKNDALTEPVINRYCLLHAECNDFARQRDKFSGNLDALIDDDELDKETKYKLQASMQQSVVNMDKQLQSKRKMLLDIEKETLMTLKSQLASIPKKAAEPKPNKFSGYGTYG